MKKKWDVHFANLYRKKVDGSITFNLLPAVEVYTDEIVEDSGVSFSWLFWSLTVFRS